MKRAAVVTALACLVAACTTYPRSAHHIVPCSAQDCDAKWALAQVWIAQNSGYRIRIATDSVIETFGPMGNSPALAYQVTRRMPPGQAGSIDISVACNATVYGCFTNPEPGALALGNALRSGR